MGKFSPSISTPAPIVTTPEVDTTEEDQAAERLRLAEKKRRGRRASILSDIGREDIQSAAFGRPSATASNTIQPPQNLFGS